MCSRAVATVVKTRESNWTAHHPTPYTLSMARHTESLAAAEPAGRQTTPAERLEPRQRHGLVDEHAMALELYEQNHESVRKHELEVLETDLLLEAIYRRFCCS